MSSQTQPPLLNISQNNPPGSFEESGITRNENGNYILPPVIVQQRGRNSHTLTIEVGPVTAPLADISNASTRTVSELFRTMADASSRERTPTIDNGNMGTTTNNNNNNDNGSNSTTDITDTSNNNNNNTAVETITDQPSTSTNASTELAIPQHNTISNNSGVRGLDYPAFDVSNDGLYNDPSQPTSRLLAPLQRVLDRLYRQSPPRIAPISPVNEINQLSNNNNNNNTSPNSTGNNIEANNNSENPTSPSLINTESRNIILTVNYVYGGNSNESNVGSLLLYVPSIDETNEENVSVLVRLATEIALRTIAVTLKKSSGVSKLTFEKLQVVKLEDLKENEQDCPICYDKYVEKEDYNKNKRRLSNNDNNDNLESSDLSSAKRIKNNDGDKITVEKPETKKTEKINKKELSHYPVKLDCGHIFGASCLGEWFKTNNTCPLCREKLPSIMELNHEQSRCISITLPNLAQVISNCRPFIENFNNRQITFTTNENEEEDFEQNNESTDSTGNEARNPAELLFSPNGNNIFDRTNRNPTRGQTNTPGTVNSNNEANTPSSALRDSLISFIRDVVSSISDRTRPASVAIAAPPADGTTTTNTSTGSIRTESPIANQLSMIPVVRQVTRGQPTFGGIFPPLGVESRRTPNGVVTREIHGDSMDGFPSSGNSSGNDNDNETNNTNDTNNNNNDNTSHTTTNDNEPSTQENSTNA